MFRYLEWQRYGWKWLPWFDRINDYMEQDVTYHWETWYFGWGPLQFCWNFRNWKETH